MAPSNLKEKIAAFSEDDIRTRLRTHRPSRVKEPGLKPSAVLLPLIRRTDGWCLLFTKRSEHMENHRGEISFPGGMIEEGETALGAALRETDEELGIANDKIHILGELDEIPTITGFRIHPFVARLEWPIPLKPSATEIEKVLVLPLDGFMQEGRMRVEHWQRENQDYPVYFYDLDECTVWGATAKITRNLVERLAIDETQAK